MYIKHINNYIHTRTHTRTKVIHTHIRMKVIRTIVSHIKMESNGYDA